MHAWLGVGGAEALEERKGGFVGADLAAWQADGRALFPVCSHCSLRPALTSTLWGCKSLRSGPPGTVLCQSLLSFQRVRLCLVDIAAPPPISFPFQRLGFFFNRFPNQLSGQVGECPA